MLVRFADLPIHILELVLDSLNRREIFILAHASRKLSKIATPRLYRSITFTATNSRTCARRLALLLRTLLERPHVTSRITAFRLLGDYSDWINFDALPEDPRRSTSVKLWSLSKSTKVQLLLTPQMFSHFVDDVSEITQAQLQKRCKDGLAALVMSLLTRLKRLELSDGFLAYSSLLPQIIRRTDYLFPYLERVVLGNWQSSRSWSLPYVDMNLISPMFYSSTITSFECMITEPWKFSWTEPLAPCSITLTSLRLFRSNVSRSTLIHLLSATPNLKSFYYEHEVAFNHSTTSSIAPFLELDGLNAALSCVKNTLEHCQLILRLAPGSMSPAQFNSSGSHLPAVEGTLSSLKAMPRLTYVEVPMVMLFGWNSRSYSRLEQLLPPSMTELTLRDDFFLFYPWYKMASRERRIARIGKYLRGRMVHAPYLRVLNVRLTSAKEELRGIMQDLQASSEHTAVETTKIPGTKSETWCWHLDLAKVNAGGRPELGPRVDSVLRTGSPED